MTSKQRALPETMVAPETGEILTRDVRPFTVTYKGQSIVVDLPGYYPESDNEGVLVGDDMAAADEAQAAALADAKGTVESELLTAFQAEKAALTSNHDAEPSAKANSVSLCTGTRCSMQRRSSAKTLLCSMPGQASIIRWPSSSVLGRRLCTAAAGLR